MLENIKKNELNTISVVGLGYIGLPTAAVIASRKIKVIGIDISINTVDIINQGRIHIVEPDLDIIVHAVVKEGYLEASTQAMPADAFIIAVPTPFTQGHQPDLSYIESAINSIAPVLNKGNLVILESTSPVGTTEKMAHWLAQARPDLNFPHTHGDNADIQIAYCPERVLPGHVLRELVQNDRIIGGLSATCSERALQLYKIFVEGECLITNARTAEMCKLTENSFRDVNIAFANELSMICDQFDINVWELIKFANRHPRVNILQPGPGVGGHCVAVDPWFLISQSPELTHVIQSARKVNNSKPGWVIEKVKSAIQEVIKLNPGKMEKDVTIACFGLAFKADIDDLRESPALDIATELAHNHAGHVVVVEPNIDKLPACLEGIAELKTINHALEESDIALLLVDHSSFKKMPDNSFNNHIIIDTRGIWTKSCG